MRTLIIAEISWCHLGNMKLAEEMIKSAASTGVDYVKFQSWSVKNLKPGEWDKDGRREIYESAELSKDDHDFLINVCKNNKVKFLTSVFSKDDLNKLPQSYGSHAIKIPSTEINNFDLIEACNFDNIYISTGASSFYEVQLLLKTFPHKNITLLHCVSSYPCKDEKCNLNKIHLLNILHSKVGYSDHTIGVNAPFYAISNKAHVLEKHFTVDSSLPGRDNKFAATPDIMKQICDFRDFVDNATSGLEVDYLPEEESARVNYRQRWSKNV